MKRAMLCLLVLSLLLCGCAEKKAYVEDNVINTAPGAAEEALGGTPGRIDAVQTPETTEAATVPTEPEVFRNPLNGEILDAPFTGRVYANTVSNMQENMPHVGVIHADVVMEMYANMNNVVRCLALFTDIEQVAAIGSTRSTRPIFNDIAQHYDLVLSYAGGSDTALQDLADRGIDHVNIDTWEATQSGASYRDTVYKRSYENSLLGIGAGIKSLAQTKGIAMELEKDYGFRFAEEGTPPEGEAADVISWTMVYKQAKKDTSMVYNPELGKYVWNQYGKEMTDQITGDLEAFTNVIIMQADITNNGIYYAADFVAGGTGYYACGGKLIPITWSCADEDSAFRFLNGEGQDLELGVGNTYIAIVTPESPVAWESSEPAAPLQEAVAGGETAAAEN